jgi:hypothetical protein
MTDHDQRFKTLLQEFFGDFLRLFFRPWAERLDCEKVEWLDKEVFPDPPEGSRHVLDLVARLPTRQAVAAPRAGDPESWLALIHVEIESPDKVAPLRPRMFRAYASLRARHGLPVLPIGLYLRVGLEGIGVDAYEEHFWELRPVRFEYLYVGLPALDAVEYVGGENWLGVALAALMRVPRERAAWLGAEALRRLQAAPLSDQQRFLLGECVQAYLPLDPQQQQEFQKFLSTGPYQGVQAMNTTWYEKGLEKGLEKGREEGREEGREQTRRTILGELLEEKFGVLSAPVQDRLQHLAADRLVALTKAVLRANSLRELGLED